tara:strand:- start:97223 stop:97663 length:441 start_codon:yes stop_codon:yes gene_type:complete
MKSTDSTLVDEFQTQFPDIARDLGDANLAILLEGASVQEIAPERIVIRDRMPVDFLFFVLAGTLSVSIEDNNKSMRLAQIKPGEWMGEVSVLSGELLASATVTTETPCKLLRVHHMTFEKLLTDNEAVAQVLLKHFINLMTKRLRG